MGAATTGGVLKKAASVTSGASATICGREISIWSGGDETMTEAECESGVGKKRAAESGSEKSGGGGRSRCGAAAVYETICNTTTCLI